MSYIDTFNHEFIGFIGGVPIYHPLETVIASNIPSEFGCSSHNLIIGGGDGEHPAIIITDLQMVAAHFIQHALAASDPEGILPEEVLTILDAAWDSKKFLVFPGWEIESYITFYRRYTSLACQTPYNSDKFTSVESWFLGSIGEFVYFSMQEMCQDIVTITRPISAILRQPYFLNVTIPPPGTPLVWGRKHDASGNIQWGVSRWS